MLHGHGRAVGPKPNEGSDRGYVLRKDQGPAHHDRAETKRAKTADRLAAAEEVWAEVDAGLKARDEKTERLRAARLARDAGEVAKS